MQPATSGQQDSPRGGIPSSRGGTPDAFLLSAASDEVSLGTSADSAGPWQDNTPNCGICGTRLGKRHLAPRHHCRLCGRCVCAGCSPNSVQLAGQHGLQRACAECLASLDKTAHMRGRVMSLAQRLSGMCGDAGGAAIPGDSFEESIDFCERALAPMEQERERCASMQQKMEHLEAELHTVNAACIRLAVRLHALHRTRPPAQLYTARLPEAIALCEAALPEGATPEASRRRLCRVCGIRSPEAEASAVVETPPRAAGHRRDLEADEARTEYYNMSTSVCDTAVAMAQVSCPPEQPYRRRRFLTVACRRKASMCMGGASACLLLAFFVATAAWLWAIPALVAGGVDGANIVLTEAVLSRASAEGGPLWLRADVLVDGGGLATVRLGGFRASLGADGGEFARCDFPALRLGGGPTRSRLDCELFVTDHAAFADRAARLLRGQGDEWELTGSPAATSLSYEITSFGVKTTVKLPGSQLGDIPGATLDSVSVVGAKRDSLLLEADLAYFCPGTLQLRNLSEAVFSMHTQDGKIPLGSITVGDFRLSRGWNALRRVRLELVRTEASRPFLGEFLGGLLSGADQIVELRGPRGSPGAVPDVLQGFPAQGLHVRGAAQGLLKSLSMSSERSLKGYNPMTGWPCFPGLPCFRGPILALGSTMSQPVKLSDIVLDVNLTEDLTYDVTYPPQTIPRTANCSQGRRLFRLRSKPGMWTYMDGSRSQDASVILPKASPGTAGRLTSLFLPAEPQPAEGEGPLGRCFHTVISAVACRLYERDLNVAPVEVRGSMLLEVADFKLGVTVSQRGLPAAFADDLRELRVGPGPVKMSCGAFDFKPDAHAGREETHGRSAGAVVQM